VIWVLVILALLALSNLALVRVVYLSRRDGKVDHAKCVALISSVVSNRVVAIAFRDAANRWDSIEEQADLRRLAREQFKDDGPSMPALWLREQAAKIEASL
jgi:hypothetical protein